MVSIVAVKRQRKFDVRWPGWHTVDVMMNLRALRRVCARAIIIVLLTVTAPVLVPRANAGPVLLGLYSTVNIIDDVDAWLAPTGKSTAVAGIWVTAEDPFDVAALLNLYWNAGLVPFVNLKTRHGTAQVANGLVDGPIRDWARQFAAWAANGQRRAFIAPFQEMNGSWSAYYYCDDSPTKQRCSPLTFQQAYRRIRQIVEQELISRGASLSAVSWVFAPNGWSLPGDEFELYYPGADVVDIVSINGYNWGGCPSGGGVWETFDVAIKPYLDRLLPMAPGKPLFMAETGTVEVPARGVGNKDQWLNELFTKLASYPRFRGVVYFNLPVVVSTLPACPSGADFRLHVPGTNLWTGFWNAMNTLHNYVYWAPSSPQMATIAFGRQPAQIFADVVTIHPFALEDGEFDAAPWIHALYAAGVTSGCDTNPLKFCPNGSVTRAEMAVFLLRAEHGSGYVPPVAPGFFADVPVGAWYRDWAERLFAESITSGCDTNPPRYCPNNTVPREQIAKFLLMAKHGPAYRPPDPNPTAPSIYFKDVPASNIFKAWIDQLVVEGISTADGCGGGNFCPGNLLTRTEMAVFLVKALNLPH